MSKMILVIEDDPNIRELLRIYLEQEGYSIEIARDGLEGLRTFKRVHPDLVLLDLMMPEMNGDEATAEIAALKSPTKVLILTTYGTAEEIGRAFASGAVGALMKTVTKQDLFAAVRKVAAGERVIGADIAVTETIPSVNLSPRQREVLESVTRGLSNADIAKQLGISPSAVKLYLSAVFEKLGAASRAEAVAIALKHQLLKL